MVSFLIFLGTISIFPPFVAYFSFFFIKKKNPLINTKIDTNFLIILAIIILSFFNKVVGIHKAQNVIEIFPEIALMILVYWIALDFDLKWIKILISLIVIETFVVFVEYSLNITSFLPSLYQELNDSELLYDSRPYGLSANSSNISLKIFLSILLLVKYKPFDNKLINILILVVLIGGVIITFNRTVIISLVFFSILLFFKNFKFDNKRFVALLFIAIVIIFILFTNAEFILLQITRGREGESMLSGRVEIWKKFIVFIKENFILGNNSYKYYIDFYERKAHAHNSYLQVLATHGILIFILYILLVIRNIRRDNYVYIIPILIFSLSQYGIFWGFSITDIVLFIFYFNKFNNKNAF